MQRLILMTLLFAGITALGVPSTKAQTLETDPPRTYLQVEGPLSFSGRMAVPLTMFPYGEYRLLAEGPGLAASRLRFTVDGRGLTARRWSGPEALLKPPGLDHLGKKEGRGWVHLGAATVSGAFWGMGFGAVSDAEDRITAARAALALAPDAPLRAEASIELSAAVNERIDEQRVRDLWATLFVGSWIGAGLEAWLLTPEASLVSTSEGARVTLPRATGWGAAARSSLVPGAGQRYLGHNSRANVFSTLIAASAAGAILAQDYFLEARRAEGAARRRLNNAGTTQLQQQFQAELENATSSMDSRSKLRWVVAGSAAYFYVWNVVDAFRLGRRAESARTGPNLSLAPTRSGMALTMSWGFH